MSLAFDRVTARPDAALLAAISERLAQVLASNRRLAHSPTVNFHARRRIEAVIAGLNAESILTGARSSFDVAMIRST